MSNEISNSASQLPHLLAGVVHPWHLDQFGHMNVRCYAPFFDDASFLFWKRLGLGQQRMIDEHGVHTVTLRASTEFRSELRSGDCFAVAGQAEKLGNKSVTLRFEMTESETGKLLAVHETVEVFVENETHASMTIPDAIRTRLQRDNQNLAPA
ncbi:acyl-CoA thioesterase [Mesorhizobium shangrilense]|uniref:Thioesterase family protein n=1 Tax=Mesorhizobium shangrilense TaxID=460060 RepID=A0ABV2DLN9_9HYPH